MNSQAVRFNIFDYLGILKPRESALLAFIGIGTSLVAARAFLPPATFFHILAAIALGSAGCNALTNYLDRKVDARMERTKERALPSRRIYPAGLALPMIIAVLAVSLYLAFLLNPVCFALGLTGIAASSLWRKTVTCTFFGSIAGCIPVLIGWFAVRPTPDLEIALLSLLICFWIPLHVWTVMIANRGDYEAAGLNYFPLNLKDSAITRILLALSICLYITSIFLWRASGTGLVFLIAANVLGLFMVYSSIRLALSPDSKKAWKIYKFSAFPYLGIIFLSLCVDVLLSVPAG